MNFKLLITLLLITLVSYSQASPSEDSISDSSEEGSYEAKERGETLNFEELKTTMSKLFYSD
jgi:hypothetical protein